MSDAENNSLAVISNPLITITDEERTLLTGLINADDHEEPVGVLQKLSQIQQFETTEEGANENEKKEVSCVHICLGGWNRF